jgi:hypothetical protein
MDGLVFTLHSWHMSITLPTDSCSTHWMGIDGNTRLSYYKHDVFDHLSYCRHNFLALYPTLSDIMTILAALGASARRFLLLWHYWHYVIPV